MTQKAKVFIQAGPHKSFYGMTEEVFERNGKYDIVHTIDQSDIVVWTGGEDICPLLYGEKPLSCSHYTNRDKSDVLAVEEAFNKGKFLVGICRGAQLLNCIPNSGKLWQDVNRHCTGHDAFDTLTGEWIKVNSVHHQMMIPTKEAQLICWANQATVKEAEGIRWSKPNTDVVLEKDKDAEVIWYESTKSLCFQAHPEFNHPPTTQYFFRLIDKFYWHI